MTSKFSPDRHAWGLRYAPHVGYAPPFEPLFKDSVGDPDPVSHAAFAAAQGFAGILHPWIASRPEGDVTRFEAALRHDGLEAGCMVYAPIEDALKPSWVSRDAADREKLIAQIRSAAALAARLGARVVAALVMADPGQELSTQLANLKENLKFAADEALRKGVTLGIEPMIALPGMLFQSTYDAADLIAEVDHRGARLIFDTGHVADMDGDVLTAQARLKEVTCLYQLADAPGRTEPGSGTIDFETLLKRLHVEGYQGLVELEHGWSGSGKDIEARGIAMLRDIDAKAMAAADALKSDAS